MVVRHHHVVVDLLDGAEAFLGIGNRMNDQMRVMRSEKRRCRLQKGSIVVYDEYTRHDNASVRERAGVAKPDASPAHCHRNSRHFVVVWPTAMPQGWGAP